MGLRVWRPWTSRARVAILITITVIPRNCFISVSSNAVSTLRRVCGPPKRPCTHLYRNSFIAVDG